MCKPNFSEWSQEESNKGDLFKTTRYGKGELNKSTHETRMVECQKEVLELRDEVKQAMGRGFEAGVERKNKSNQAHE